MMTLNEIVYNISHSFRFPQNPLDKILTFVCICIGNKLLFCPNFMENKVLFYSIFKTISLPYHSLSTNTSIKILLSFSFNYFIICNFIFFNCFKLINHSTGFGMCVIAVESQIQLKSSISKLTKLNSSTLQ